MLKIEHLTAEQLAQTLRGGRMDRVQAYHLEQCGECRRALAASLLPGLLRARDEHASKGRHVEGGRLAWLHRVSYEYGEMGAGKLPEFLATLRHLERCEKCLARFLALHRSLTPSQAAVDKVVAKFVGSQRQQRLGTLTIRRSLTRLAQVFVPAADSTEESEVAEDSSVLAALERLGRLLGSGRTSPAPPLDALLLPRPSSDSIPLPASMASEALEASPLSLSAKTMAASAWHRTAGSMPDSLRSEEGLEARLAEVDSLARILAASLQEQAARLARFRREMPTDGSIEEKLQRLQSSIEDWARVSESLEAHGALAGQLQQAMLELPAELDRVRYLVKVSREHPFVSEPVNVSLPGLALEIVTHWRGDDGLALVTVTDPQTGGGRPGLSVAALRANALEPAAEVVTGPGGLAEVPLRADTTALRISVDTELNAWLIRIDVHLRESGP